MARKNISIIFAIVLLLALIKPRPSAYAMTSPEEISPTILTITPTPMAPKEIDYTMPYPGLLPDSPLYFLKTFRDRVISFFISDPLKKAQFDLLQSDKRLNSGVYLIKESVGKESLMQTTISKGDNYYEEGIVQLRQAKMQGQNIVDIAKTFNTAALKHEELLKDLEINASNSLKSDLMTDEKRIEELRKQVLGLGIK